MFAFSSLVSAENIPPSLIVTKTVSPNEVLQGATTTITFNLSATGTPRQNLDVMLLMDKSGSMLGDKISEAKIAASNFIDNLDSEHDKVGLVGFSYYVSREDLCCGDGCGPNFEEAQLLEGLTTDFDQVKNTLNILVPDSGTNTGDAINKANIELSSSSADVKVEILLSDGQPNFPVEYECVDCGENGYQFMVVDESLPITYAIDQAQEAKNNNIIIFTISLGADADQEFMKTIASTTGGTHYYAPSAGDLNDIFLSIAGALNNLIGNNIVITDVISAGVDLDPQSLPEGCIFVINENKTTTVTCFVGSMSIGDPDKSVSFIVIPNDSDLTTINDSAQVDYDTFDNIHKTVIITEQPTITIQNVAPTIDPIDPKIADENTLLSFSVIAHDFGDDIITLTASTTLPTGATFVDNGNATGTFSWTPGFDQSGNYTITFTASDGKLSTDRDVLITINNIDKTSPVITILGDNPANLTVGGVYTDAGATSTDDIDGDITSKIISTSTVNMSVAGVYSVIYTVSDLAGNNASSTRIVNVSNPVVPPVVLGSNGGGYYGGPSSYVVPPPTINPVPVVVESPVVIGRVLGVDTSEDETTDSTGGATSTSSTSDEIINNQSATILDASENVDSGLLMWILIWLILLIILICLYIIYKRRKRKQN